MCSGVINLIHCHSHMCLIALRGSHPRIPVHTGREVMLVEDIIGSLYTLTVIFAAVLLSKEITRIAHNYIGSKQGEPKFPSRSR